MKKVFYLVAIATLALVSCQKELNPAEQTQNNKPLTFKASIEQLQDQTKATINASNQLVWATGDKIGIFFNSWAENKNQSFTLSSGASSTEGEFTIDTGWSFNPSDATAAFYPWDDNDNAGDGTNNNVSDGTVYFTLHEGNYSYSNGKMITPLVASLSSSNNISFKHAGAAVKVHINNVPAHSKSIGMSVEGQQVHGYYHIDAANAGTAAMEVNGGTADISMNSVWLNYWNGSQSAWDFIFPVPELTTPKLSFQMWDENDVLVWSKKLKAQSSNLGRGDILVMPPIDITPYSQFKESTEWAFCGTIGSGGNDDYYATDIPMYTDGTVCILKGVTFKTNDKIKIRKNKSWDEAYPSSGDLIVTSDCTKDVWFDINTHEITLKDAKCDYPAPKVTLYFGINGSTPHGVAISSSALAPGYAWPGMELTEKEYINDKPYYKLEVDGPAVWGKSISDVYIVGISSWNTSNSTITFNNIKTEYYFEATASTVIEQLSARPATVVVPHTAITIDGTLSEWDNVDGITVGNHTVKVESDATNLYFYSSRTNASGDYAAIWGGGGYVYVSLDLDNDSTTGDGSIYGNNGEFVGLLYPYAGSSASPAFNESPTSSWQASPSPYSVASVALKGVETSGTATIEFSIPRANLPTIPSTPITVKLWGNKGMSTVSFTHTF